MHRYKVLNRCRKCACGVRIGRWTGNRLADGELEPRYGHTKRKEK